MTYFTKDSITFVKHKGIWFFTEDKLRGKQLNWKQSLGWYIELCGIPIRLRFRTCNHKMLKQYNLTND